MQRADYADVRSTANVDRLNAELSSIHAIMTTNIEDALGRGKRLDEVQDLAAQVSEALRFCMASGVCCPLKPMGPVASFFFFFFFFFFLCGPQPMPPVIPCLQSRDTVGGGLQGVRKGHAVSQVAGHVPQVGTDPRGRGRHSAAHLHEVLVVCLAEPNH